MFGRAAAVFLIYLPSLVLAVGQCSRRPIVKTKLKGNLYESAIWTNEKEYLKCARVNYPIKIEVAETDAAAQKVQLTQVLATDNKFYVAELTCSETKDLKFKDTIMIYTKRKMGLDLKQRIEHDLKKLGFKKKQLQLCH
ncbi:uncharacterized protein LOC115624497 [Scaptodrosophila lebanonensis]|uniref:Uncharacterized protein LOC115624497 n=1 Tax=Drosophila lebanonensis TaxID=7225 RepID=A0A6J2TE57_DROLE|nr:uncharacterized protein LOC115624497 [Scaptodrosophila lebanonensis]